MRSFEFARKMENGKPIVYPTDRCQVDAFEQAYPNAQLPEYQTLGAAGADFFSAEDVVIPSIWKLVFEAMKEKIINKDERFDIKPTFVHTGIKSQMEDDEVLELYNRSSNPKKVGLILANSVGIIDSDYYNNVDNDGEIMFAFYNFKLWDVTIHTGDRIGQGIFKKILRPTKGLRVKEDVRKGGIGSTGK